MNILSQIDRDLLLLMKGHYGVFNDANARERIARLITHHCAISLQLASHSDTLSHWLGQLLSAVCPEFSQQSRNMIALLSAYGKSPEEGLRYVIGYLTLVPMRDDVGNRRFDMGKPDPAVRRYLDAESLPS